VIGWCVSKGIGKSKFFTAGEFFYGGFSLTGTGAIVIRLTIDDLLGPTFRVKIFCTSTTLVL
jgi:cell division protein FtsX